MYRIFGYDCWCQDFSYEVNSFVEAVKLYKNLERHLCVVFVKGMSEKVSHKLKYGY